MVPRGELPIVTRRGVKINELSLVDQPALAGSGVRSITRRSAEMEAFAVERAKAQADQKAADRELLANVGRIIEDTEAQRAADRELFALVDQAAAQQRELEDEWAGRAQAAEVRAILREYRESQPREDDDDPDARARAAEEYRRSLPIPPYSSLPRLSFWEPYWLTPEELAAWKRT